MGLYQKLQIYRYLLQGFLIANVLVLSAGVFATINFFKQHTLQTQALQEQRQLLELTQATKDQLLRLTLIQGKGNEELYLKRRLSEEIVTGINTIARPAWPLPEELRDLVTKPSLSPESSEKLAAYVTQIVNINLGHQAASLRKLSQVDLWMMICGALTFLVGVVVPSWIFYRLGQLWQKARAEVERQARTLVQQWFENYRQYGEDAFAQSAFWLNIVLVGLENFGKRSRHPLWQVLAEISPLIRQEIRVPTEASGPDNPRA